jgi:hypothetical protein
VGTNSTLVVPLRDLQEGMLAGTRCACHLSRRPGCSKKGSGGTPRIAWGSSPTPNSTVTIPQSILFLLIPGDLELDVGDDERKAWFQQSPLALHVLALADYSHAGVHPSIMSLQCQASPARGEPARQCMWGREIWATSSNYDLAPKGNVDKHVSFNFSR